MDIKNETEQFITAISSIQIEEACYEKAKDSLIDYIGVTLAGLREIRGCYNNELASNGSVPILGTNIKTDVYSAALINGINAHAVELDDGNRFGMVHPGSPVISALLSVSFAKKMAHRDILRGIIYGYEVTIKIAKSLQPELKERGYHATGLCGTIGAAMGIAYALNYTDKQKTTTLAAACTNASGILKIIRDKSNLKPFNAGQAASNGVMSAFFGQLNFDGKVDVLGGNDGFLRMISKKPDTSHFTIKPSVNEIYTVYRKLYASCRHSHAAVEAAINLRKKFKINSCDIESVDVFTYKWGVHLHDHTTINGISSAKMSTPFSVALALYYGKAGISEFSLETIQNDSIIELTRRITVKEDQNLTELVPLKRPARLVIKKKDGSTYQEQIDLPKGEPEKPLTDYDLRDKFMSLVVWSGIETDNAKLLYKALINNENIDKVFQLSILNKYHET